MLDRTEIIILLDFYGNLLSEKQLRAMKLYYFDDYSLNEIADNEEVSKQAISNLLKRAIDKLRNIEAELRLVEKSKHSKDTLKELISFIEDSKEDDNIVKDYVHSKLLELYKDI